MTRFRELPSVDRLLRTETAAFLIAEFGRPLALEALRAVLDETRQDLAAGAETVPAVDTLLVQAEARLRAWTQPTLEPVINATGVILHTNLGRAPLSPAAQQAVVNAAKGYITLEYDLARGQRGSRHVHAEALLTRLTGAEAALVVNNNASAVLLALTALARRRRVLIARTQLVEIGGGFRVPDVMQQSGAKLVEIGTTNRVHLQDYERALAEQPIRLVMRAHRSNFRILGFHAEPSFSEIVALAHRYGVPLVDDLGSGSLLDTADFGMEHEPMVQESLAAGADLVCFSGDKLLGGPQAGLIVGRADLVAKLKRHPLTRALRPDKLCLAALSATLLHYLKDEATSQIPVWRMISTPAEMIRMRADAWQAELGFGEVWRGQSTVGGGSLPGETLPTFLLALPVERPQQTLATLRAQQPPIIARVKNDHVVLDPRTVLPEQDGALLVGVANALGR